MAIAEILRELNAEIARLEWVRKLLAEGRSVQLGSHIVSKKPARKERTLSAEARKKIAEAQQKRWAAQKAKK